MTVPQKKIGQGKSGDKLFYNKENSPKAKMNKKRPQITEGTKKGAVHN